MELDEVPCIYGLEYLSRCLISIGGINDELIQFLVGTQSLRATNQIHLITYDDEQREIKKEIFQHVAGEVWGLTALPSDSSKFASVYSKLNDAKSETKMFSSIWRYKSRLHQNKPQQRRNNSINSGTNTNFYLYESDESMAAAAVQQLELVAHLDCLNDFGDVTQIISYPGDSSLPAPITSLSSAAGGTSNAISNTDLCAIVDNHVCLLANQDGAGYRVAANAHPDNSTRASAQRRFAAARWCPHHDCNQLATAMDSSLLGWDLRSMKMSFNIDAAHSNNAVRDLDYNPNAQFYLASCGDDCKVNIWDLRNTRQGPAMSIEQHSHWVWTVRYNFIRDQLILSGGSDSRVCLHQIQSLAHFDDEHDDDEDYDDDDSYEHVHAGDFDAEEDDDDKHLKANNNDNNKKSLENDKEDSNVAQTGKNKHAKKLDKNSTLTKQKNMKQQKQATRKDPVDKVLRVYEEHEDSVYALEWSRTDPWHFASLSYDGRLIINQVPKKTKYDILLNNSSY